METELGYMPAKTQRHYCHRLEEGNCFFLNITMINIPNGE
jgi:hypothetical protein